MKKIKDYAFIHFEDRDHAVNAMKELDGKDLGGSNLEVCVSFVNIFRLGWARLQRFRFLLTGVPGETSVRQEEEGGNPASSGKAHEPVSDVKDGNCWVMMDNVIFFLLFWQIFFSKFSMNVIFSIAFHRAKS